MRSNETRVGAAKAGTAVTFVAISFLLSGCSGEQRVPVAGKVFYQGEPLEFGSIVLQPDAGPPARGSIQADGAFRVTVPGEAPGVAPGGYTVRVSCYEGQDPDANRPGGGEVPLGKSLIPNHYSSVRSGIRVEIPLEGDEALEIRLTDAG